MKKGAYAFITFLLLLAMISPAAAQMNHKMDHQAEGETKIVDGIKGRLKVTPAMSMFDLYLADAKTGHNEMWIKKGSREEKEA